MSRNKPTKAKTNTAPDSLPEMSYYLIGVGYKPHHIQTDKEQSDDFPFLAGLSDYQFNNRDYVASIKRWDIERQTLISYDTGNLHLLHLCHFACEAIDALGTGYDKEMLDTVKADACMIFTKFLSNSTIELIEKDFIVSENYYLKLEIDLEDAGPGEFGRLKVALYKNRECIKSSLTSIELFEHLTIHRNTLIEINIDTNNLESVIDKTKPIREKIAYTAIDRDGREIESKGYETVTRVERIRRKLEKLGDTLIFDERGILLVDIYDPDFNKENIKAYNIPKHV